MLEASVDRILDAILRTQVRLFDNREVLIAPYATVGTTDPRAWKPGMISAFYGGSGTGWSMGITVLQSDVPGWDELMAENRALIEERDALIREYFSGL